MTTKSVIIIGFGSSGKRFADILSSLGYKTAVFNHKKEKLGDLSNFSAAIVSSPTSTHSFYLKQLIGGHIPTFVEKPIADNLEDINQIIDEARRSHAKIKVGFNLRYLPIVVKIIDYLKNGKLGEILHADIYVGQYLPDWRPNKDYRKTYSASFTAGGGVALDLIHEIDLAQMWFGGVDLRLVRSGKLGNLEIDTEDFVQFANESRPYIKVTLDYLNTIKTRRYTIVGSEGSVECDVFGKRFSFRSSDGEEEILTSEDLFDIKKTYEEEIRDFLIKIEGGQEFGLSDRNLGLDSLKLALKARKHVQR